MSSAVPTPPGAQPILELRSLKKSYENGRIEALRGVSLNIAAGDFLAISGASGSGKSTMLHLLGGLDTPTQGSVLFRGQCIGKAQNGAPAIDLDTYRARWVGFIFQSFHLLASLNAMENVQVPMLGNKAHIPNREEKARALLVELGLEHRLRQYPNQLSAGERQRVAIARALVNDPPLLLADEPTGNLDSVNSGKILQLLAEIQARHGMTLIMVTHDEGIAASAHRHVVMKDGLLWK
jgi:lipoprotein-releasing system ATP-binding protein